MTRKEFHDRIISQLPVMYRVAYSLSGDKEEAGDLVQDTMVRLWDNRETLDNITNHTAYCITVMKHRYYDMVKSRRATETLTTEPEALIERDELIDHRSSLELVQKIIDTLPEGQRAVIRLSAFAGQSNEEISEITGYSHENVRTLLSRARKNIKKLFTLNN